MIGQPAEKNTFDFYNGYLTVVYGLLVTNGLSYVVKFTNKNPSLSLESINGLLFLGTFLTSLHFWFACATVDDLADRFYRVLAGNIRPAFQFFVLIDIIVATIFAGLLLAMFDAIPDDRFFLWFLVAAGLSLLYDLYSRALVSVSGKWRLEVYERSTTKEYGARINAWIRADSVFVFASGAIYYANARTGLRDSAALGSLFVLCTACLLLGDVWSFRTADRLPSAVADSKSRHTAPEIQAPR